MAKISQEFSVSNKPDEGLSVFDFGAVGDGVTDDSLAIQAAINAAQDSSTGSAQILFPTGQYLINTPLFVTTSGNINITFQGANKYNTRLVAGPSLAASVKPTMSGVHSPVLAFAPIMAWDNTTGCTINDLGFDGNDENVYGLYVNESFFTTFSNVRIRNCNQRPFTGIRIQDGTFIDFAAFDCGQGVSGFDGSVLLYDTSGLVFLAPNFERNGTDRYSLDIFQPNNKGQWTFINPWFETGSVTNKPALGFMSGGGRNGKFIGSYMTYGSTGGTQNLVDFKAASDTITRDSVVMTTSAAQSWDVEVNDVSNPTQSITCASDAKNCRIHGFFDAAKIVNNAAASNGNSFEPSTFGDATGYQSVSGGFRVNNTATAGGLPIGTNDYIALFEAAIVKLFGNPDNYLRLVAGDLELHSNARLSIESGSNDIRLVGLPTSDPGGSNVIWDNSGVLNIT